VSSAVAGVILANLTVSLGGYTLPSQTGFRVVLLIGAGAALTALAIASFIPRSPAQVSGEEGEGALQEELGGGLVVTREG
jgi:hypothetical protein